MIAKIPSNNNEFTIIGNIRNLNLDDKVAVRIHYQCETSEIFGSNHCDCKEQLDTFLDIMQNNNNSILIYCHEEGRGLGLFNKINAYYLTATEKLDTNDAMLKVAGKTENRMFEIPADILFYLGIKNIEL
jgi:GTP cyclohydrolase II